MFIQQGLTTKQTFAFGVRFDKQLLRSTENGSMHASVTYFNEILQVKLEKRRVAFCGGERICQLWVTVGEASGDLNFHMHFITLSSFPYKGK